MSASRKFMPSGSFVLQKPSMGGEDFAFLAGKIPSCYMFIGTGKKDVALHSSTYILDESVIPFGAYYLSNLILNLLARC